MVKRTPKSKEATRLKLLGLTYREIGELLGVTRQRAQQLVRPPVGVWREVRDAQGSKCADCGADAPYNGHIHHHELKSTVYEYNLPGNLVYLCNSCHCRRHRDPYRIKLSPYLTKCARAASLMTT